MPSRSESSETPSQVVPSFDQRVTQCRSTLKAWRGKLRNAFESHRLSGLFSSRIVNSQWSSGTCGVGPADKTGKSVVRYCPGGSFAVCFPRFPKKPRDTISMWIPPTSAGCFGGRLSQSAPIGDKTCNLINALAVLQIREDERPMESHLQGVRFHHVQVRSDERGQIDLVDHEKIRPYNSRATLARYFFAFGHINYVNGEIRQLGTEGSRKIVASRLDKAEFRVREFPVHVINRSEVHGSVLADCRVRATTSLDTHDAFCRKSFRSRENELVLFRVNIVRYDVDVV